MKTSDILDKLPFELEARLVSDPFFKDIPVIVAVKGNVAAQYAAKQAIISEKGGKSGVAVFVLQIVADDIYPGLGGGPMQLNPSFQVVENVEINNGDSGTGKSARKIARHIIKTMKLTSFRGLADQFRCAKPAIEPFTIKDQPDALVCEQVNFICKESGDEKYNYCLPPVLSQVPGQPQLQMTCATGAADIWYTTDDTFPYPGDKTAFPNSTAQLYQGPIQMVADQTLIIRACAYLNDEGYIPSSIERFTTTTNNN